MSAHGRGKGGRWRRSLKWAARVALVGLLLVVALAGVVLLLLTLPVGRQWTARIASEQLSNALIGRVEITPPRQVRLDRIAGFDVTVWEPNGRAVLRAERVEVSWRPQILLRSLVAGTTPHVDLSYLGAERVELDLKRQEEPPGLLLARALSPANQQAEEGVAQAEDEQASLLLAVDDIAVSRVTIHRAIAGDARPIELAGVGATLLLAEALYGSVNVANLRVPVPGIGAEFAGALEGQWANLGAPRGPLAQLRLHGGVGSARLQAKAALQAEQWAADASVLVPPEAWSGLGVPVGPSERLALALKAKGNFDQAELRAETDIGTSRITWGALAELQPLRFAVRAHSPGLDPAELRPDWPTVSLPFTFSADVAALQPLHLSATWQLQPFEYEGRRMPGSWGAVTLDERRWFGQLEASGQGSALSAQVELTNPAFEALRWEAALRLSTPHRFQREWLRTLGVAALEQLSASSSGSYDLQARAVDASGALKIAGLSLTQPEARLRRAAVSGSLSAREGRWQARMTTTGQRLASGPLRVASWGAKVEGGLPRLEFQGQANGELEGEPFTLMGRGRTRELQPPTLAGVRIYLARNGRAVFGDIEQLQWGADKSVRALRLVGVGKVLGDWQWSSRGQRGDLQIYELDLEALSKLLSPWVPASEGTVNLRLKMDASDPIGGRIQANASDLRLLQWQFGELALDLSVQAGRASGRGLVRLDADSWAMVDVEEVSLRELRALEGQQLPSSGSGRLSFDMDLADLAARVPQLSSSWAVQGRASGRLESRFGAQAKLVANAALIGPQVLPLKAAAGPEGRSTTRAAVPGAGLDFSSTTWVLDADYRLESGKLDGALRIDRGGRATPLVAVSLATEVPLRALLEGELQRLEQRPLQATIELREAQFEELPVGLLAGAGAARVHARADVAGSWGDPAVNLRATVHEWSSGGQRRSDPVTLELEAAYAERRATGELTVTHEQRAVGHARVQLYDTDLFALDTPSRFEMSTELAELPLGCFPFLRDYGVTGALSARATLMGDTESEATVARQMQIEFSGRDVTVLDVDFDQFDGSLRFGEHELAGVLELSQAEQGELDATLRASAPRGTGLSKLKPDRVSLHARHFQVSPLLLLFNDQLSELQGYLDGSLLAEFGDSGVSGRGRLTFTRGAVQVPQIGERFSDVHVALQAEEGGTLRFEEIRARAASGELHGDGWLHYDRLGVREVEAQLQIPSRHPFPVVYQGVRFGWLDGKLTLSGRREGEELALALHAPELDVRVEQRDFSVQSLTPSKSVKVGAFDTNGRFVELAEASEEPEAKVTNTGPSLEIRLGDDVWIYRGQGTFTSVEGSVVLLPNGTFDGELTLDEGRIDVMGRVFEVRYGTVTFAGKNPPVPTVTAQAVWPSPSGHEIIAEFRGPISSGTLELRAEPPLTYSQILSALLFGDPEGDMGSGEGGGSAAGAVASTVASAGLGRALSDLSNLDVQASVDVSDTAAPRPEVRVRLSPRVALQVSYNPVSSPLSEIPDSALLSVDWRLSPRWSLETTFGNYGTSMFDAIWRFRY